MIKFAATQVLLAAPFLKTDPWAYAHGAFDLGRVFLYKWTVNWRFLAEETFLDKRLALGLLIGHLSVLAVFGWFRWCNPDGGAFNVLSRGLKRPLLPAGLAVVTPDCSYNHLNSLLRSRLTAIHRCRHRSFHLQPDRYTFREVLALPVLLLVCSAAAIPRLEDAVSCDHAVSATLTVRVKPPLTTS